MQKISSWYALIPPICFSFFFPLLLFVKLLLCFVLVQPVGDGGETKSMYKEVVLGGDVWDLLDEIMIYMGNPMQYYEKGVKFVRVIISKVIEEKQVSCSYAFNL